MKRKTFEPIVKLTALFVALSAAGTPLKAAPPQGAADRSVIAVSARPLATEAQFEIEIGERHLFGIVTTPTQKAAATAIIVPGAGNLDENGDDGAFVKGGTYKLLANGLAANGITMVRYRRLTISNSDTSKEGPRNNSAISEDIDQTKQIIDNVTERFNIRCVWLIGHSEGGLISSIISQKSDRLCGLILLASPGRTLGDIMRWRFKSEPILMRYRDKAFSIISDFERNSEIDYESIKPPLSMMFNKSNDRYYRSRMTVNPLESISKCRVPVMIVQGLADIQVSLIDAEMIQRACKAAVIYKYKNMNHFLRKSVENGTLGRALEYQDDRNTKIMEGITGDISHFIISRSNN